MASCKSILRLAGVGALISLSALPTATAQPPGGRGANLGTGPQLPKSGTIPRDTARERSILAQTKVPAGFKVTLFAGPPVAMYPTAVAASPDGSVYVGVDLNLAQGAVAGRGRIMRLVDTDNDGQADQYTTFVDVASPRGIIADGKTVYVMHPPNLTAYRDTNGDGIADESDDLVKGLGFGLDVRSADHSTNNITMGIDGWIYVAVGDYGYADAVGKDGTRIKQHGGSVVRVRPDGTGLEIYAKGTRNIYDVGIDPFMHVFARDNTNDGGGWNTRFHYIPPNAEMGYPSLFLNFPDEPMQTLFDFGAGSGTGGLWIQDPGFPAALNNQLFTSDWTLNKVLFNPVTKRGASYSVKQEDFLEISHPVDFAMDDRSHMYVASLIGGVFNYAGDTVGAILSVSYPGRPASKALKPSTLTEAQLVTALVSSNSQHRLWAQRELVQRKSNPALIARLRQLILDPARPAESRAAAVFTLPLLAGAESHALLKQLTKDPVLGEVALRSLADVRRARADVSASMYVAALRDARPGVRVQAINGLVRLGATAQASALIPFLASPDSALAHLAVRALASLGARDEALKAIASASPVVRTRARFALQQMHDVATVNALIAAVNASPAPLVKRELLATLARLYNTDAPWNGDWWGTRPNTVGPYFELATWEGSAAIKPVLRAALTSAAASELTAIATLFARNRVVPVGAQPLLTALGGSEEKPAALDALVGASQVTPAMVPWLARMDGTSAGLHSAVAQLLAGESSLPSEAMPLVKRAALDAALSDTIRGQLISTISSAPVAAEDVAAILALVNPAPSTEDAATSTPSNVEAAWRRYVGARERSAQLDYFLELSKTGTVEQHVLAFAVLLQSVRSPRVQPAVRDKVVPAITAAWSDAAAASVLARAVRIMRLQSQYAEQLKTAPNP